MEHDDKINLFETGQVFGFPVNVTAVLSQLQQDMRDDWYVDALGYADIYSDPNYVMDVVLSCLNDWGGVYIGDTRVLRSIPKQNFAERYSLETDFFDRFVYQAICTFLAPRLDTQLSHRVLSYRHNRQSDDRKYLFRPKINKWLDYEGFTYRFVQNEGHLAATDVSNFFENVSSKQVLDALTSLIDGVEVSGYEKGQLRAAVRVLSLLFTRWTLNGDFGLPQNRDCSSFLSNVLLSSVDFEMQSLGYDYYRYVDDIRVVCESQHEARRALQDLIGLLRKVGMNINSSKTEILSYNDPKEKIEEHFPSQNPLVLAIASMWKSQSRRVFIRSIEYVVQILREALEKKDTQSRSFRFAVNRLSQLVEAGLFDVNSEDASALLDYSLKSLSTDAVSSDQLCKLIMILDPDESFFSKISSFLQDRSLCIHDWQNHKLWILLASVKYDADGLRVLAESLLNSDPESGECSGVIIWLHSVGYLDPLVSILDRYSPTWPYQNQRYFLIAMGSLPANKQKALFGKVPRKLLGTTRRAKKALRSDGVALAERERPSFAALYEDIKDYS